MTHRSTRREFLGRLGAAAVAQSSLVSLFNGCAPGLATYRLGAIDRRVILSLADFPELRNDGGAIELEIESIHDPLVVVRRSESEFVALSLICTHQGCTVWKEPSFFRCPCHGSTYALDGSIARGPAEKPLAKYRTESIHGQLIIYL